MSVIGGSSFQTNRNIEGFNGERSRIGIQGNQNTDCLTTDSSIGFGISGAWGGLTCGNRCKGQCSNGDKSIPAFGYVLIK
jgi:hypothetical protein